jgi:hypothetical protein
MKARCRLAERSPRPLGRWTRSSPDPHICFLPGHDPTTEGTANTYAPTLSFSALSNKIDRPIFEERTDSLQHDSPFFFTTRFFWRPCTLMLENTSSIQRPRSIHITSEASIALYIPLTLLKQAEQYSFNFLPGLSPPRPLYPWTCKDPST